MNKSCKPCKWVFKKYNVPIQVIRQLVTELIQKTRSSLLWHYVLLTLQGKEIKHSFLGHSSAASFWEEIKIRLWPSWGFILCVSCRITALLQVLSEQWISAFSTHEHHCNSHKSAPPTPASPPTFSLLLVEHIFSWHCFQAHSTLPEPLLIPKQALQKAHREHKGARHIKWKRVPLQH